MEWGLLGGMLEGWGTVIYSFILLKKPKIPMIQDYRVDTRYVSNELRDFVARRYIAVITSLHNAELSRCENRGRLKRLVGPRQRSMV